MNKLLLQFLLISSVVSFGMAQSTVESSSAIPLRAWRLYWGGEKDDAKDLLQKTVAKKPKDMDALIFLSFIETHMGNKLEGDRLLNVANGLAKTNSEMMRLAGIISLWFAEDNKAINEFNDAIRLNPSDEAAHAFLGLAYYRASRRREGSIQYSVSEYLSVAINELGKSLSINSANSMAYFYQGNALKKMGKNEEAIAALDKAIKVDSTNWEARLNIASILVSLNRKPEALKQIDYLDKTLPAGKETWALYRQAFDSGLGMFRY